MLCDLVKIAECICFHVLYGPFEFGGDEVPFVSCHGRRVFFEGLDEFLVLRFCYSHCGEDHGVFIFLGR